MEIVKEEMPDAFVSKSSEVLPQIREYERSSTIVANVYVGPKLTVYLSNLENKLKKDGLDKAFYVTASNGGMMTCDTAIRHASATLLSGPAAGSIGAIFFSKLLGEENIILMDMGGTSFDVSLVNQGEITLSTEGEVAGYRIAKPMIDIHTVGAGGGSVAWLDTGGMLRVGPESAYSDPGPICYDIGGEKPTVTDANLMLGYLNKDYFLGGELQVNYDKTYKGIEKIIAEPLGMNLEEACLGIFKIVNQNMADATKVVSVQRGHDPREFALVSAGGACSIHACKIAEEIGSQKVIVPKAASVFCALGMLESDIKLDNVRSFTGTIPGLDLELFNKKIAQTEIEALNELQREGVKKERSTLLRFLDVRYVGQHHEVTVTIPNNCVIEPKHLEIIANTFHKAHEKLYTYSTPETTIEIINLRITAVGHVDKSGLFELPVGEVDLDAALKNKRLIRFEEYDEAIEVNVYDRDKIKPGTRVEGPAVIEERITTIIIHPNWNAYVDGYENVIMEVK